MASSQISTPQKPRPAPLRIVLLALFFIVLGICGLIGAFAFYSPGTSSGNLAIQHTPPPASVTVAQPITFSATVTGNQLNGVDLSYHVISRSSNGSGVVVGDLVTVPMLLMASGGDLYSYTLPASEVSGVYIEYYISAFDTAGNIVRTGIYNIALSDFSWDVTSTDVTVTRNIPRTVQVQLDGFNSFNGTVAVSVSGSMPIGMQITPTQTQVAPTSVVTFNIQSADNTQITTKYNVEVDATYQSTTSSAIRIVRSTTLVVTVTDFDFNVQPAYTSVQRGNDGSYTLTMNVYNGFTTENGFQTSVTGLPANTNWQLILLDDKIHSDGTEAIRYTLLIKTNSSTPTGLFLFQVSISANTAGGTVTHTQSSIQINFT